MKVARFCFVLLVSACVFGSCKPNGIENSHDAMAGTPTKADTVLPHKFHPNNADTIRDKSEDEPLRLKR